MIPSPRELIHLCTTDEWESAKEVGERRPEQVHLPANRLYAGRGDMVLLRLDPNLLGAPVRWEPGVPSDPEAMTFPHLYGPLPVAAVTSVTPYLPDAGGRFAELPQSET
jgi:uncharacterized protein (DUF952 family)